MTVEYTNTQSEQTNANPIAQRLRKSLENGAEWVEGGKAPVHVFTDQTLKLNRISHNAAARLVRVQADFIEGSVHGAAQRLQAVAKARTVSDLLRDQIELLRDTRARISTDARKTLDVLGDTRDDLAALVRETLIEFRNQKDQAKNEIIETGEKALDSVENLVEEVKPKTRRTTKSS